MDPVSEEIKRNTRLAIYNDEEGQVPDITPQRASPSPVLNKTYLSSQYFLDTADLSVPGVEAPSWRTGGSPSRISSQ